jgi:hypothetical protein
MTGFQFSAVRAARAVALAAVLVAAFVSHAAADPEPSAQKFAQDCRRDMAACQDVFANLLGNSSATCTPSLEQVLAQIDKHPEWGRETWTRGVTSAVAAICERDH